MPGSLGLMAAGDTAEIGRGIEALAGGPEDLPTSAAPWSVDLERERARLEAELLASGTRPDAPGRLQQTLDGLLDALHRVGDVLAAGTLEERRAVVRSFLAGTRIETATRQAVLRWYRLPRDLSAKVVELRGVALDRVRGETLALPVPGGRPRSLVRS